MRALAHRGTPRQRQPSRSQTRVESIHSLISFSLSLLFLPAPMHCASSLAPRPERHRRTDKPPGCVCYCLLFSCSASLVRKACLFFVYQSPLGTQGTVLLSDELEPRSFHELFSGLFVCLLYTSDAADEEDS